MQRDEARELFKRLDLTYSKLNREDLDKLLEILSEELIVFTEQGGADAKEIAMKSRKPRIKDVKFLRSGLQYAHFHVKGSYFERRESISFNQTGFIGFGGEFDDNNVQPILKAFCRWCHMISREQLTSTNYECSNCDEVMAIKCTEDIEHCPCCGMSHSLSLTDKPVSKTATTAENWTHKNTDGYDGCGATYSVTCDAPVEYCPNCNGQWG